jgi:hypothetical protein
MSHTPGPWIIYNEEHKPAAILPAGRSGEICQFATAYENEANARLIASALMLLEALEDCAERMERAKSILSKDGNNWNMMDTVRARAAIAAARGEV